MNESLEAIKKLIGECSVEELTSLKQHLRSLVPHPLETEWNIDSDSILDAIRRSNDITKRGMRGIIAEAVFEHSVLPSLERTGWNASPILGDLSYDVHLLKDSASVRIQIKLQRLVKGTPYLYHPNHYEKGTLYVVEVQKTRTGEKKPRKRKIEIGQQNVAVEQLQPTPVKTRPYSFTDFDILAVNMHPSSKNWSDFRYTVASWLLPRAKDQSLIEIMQPVAATANDVWTTDLTECLEWLISGETRSVLKELLHRKPKIRRAPIKKDRKKRGKPEPSIPSKRSNPQPPRSPSASNE